jgi:hypothetical protein
MPPLFGGSAEIVRRAAARTRAESKMIAGIGRPQLRFDGMRHEIHSNIEILL